jgi:zinc transport system substrate-binding protein
MKRLLLAAALLSTTPALAEPPRVVASIKPVHSLVAQVMGELGAPDLLVEGAASPHAYSLKPSDARALQAAQLVFWTGHGLELFLGDALDTLAPTATVVELADAPGLTLLPPREGGAFEEHEEAGDGHEHEHEHEHGEEADMHFFLDPVNAVPMVNEIARALSETDPENAATYAANAARAVADLEAMTAEITERLAPVADRPFVVFHDAVQYFEQRFGLTVAGSITVNADIAPGAARIGEIRAKLASLDAVCVFAEPQFDPRLVEVLTEGTGARSGVLDPEGASLEPGPGLYRQLVGGLADSIVDCLE